MKKSFVWLTLLCFTIVIVAGVILIKSDDEKKSGGNEVVEHEKIVSSFIHNVEDYSYEEVDQYFKSRGVNTITIPIVWRDVEKVEGEYDFSIYHDFMDYFSDKGYKFIVILDAAGRAVEFEGDTPIARSIPDWIWDKYPDSHAIDFYGGKYNNFDFADKTHRESLYAFYRNSISEIGEKYRDNIVGFAPGIMPEFEIKFGQEGYKWQSYSEAAQKEFTQYLAEEYTTIEELNKRWKSDYEEFSQIEMSVVDYNNNLNHGYPSDDAGFKDLMEFREQLVIEYVKPLTEIIHNAQFDTVGYFGQTFSAHDAIYASGVVEKLSDEIDIAVMDFNFYDGYGEWDNTSINSFLVNYGKSIGYKKVIAGIYLERLSPSSDNVKMIEQTIDNVYESGLADGIELGGISPSESKWNKLKPIEQDKFSSIEQNDLPNIAVYSSQCNFYTWHGEHSFEWNYLTESLVEAYNIILQSKKFNVNVIGDDIIQSDRLNDYDLVVIPSQIAVPSESKAAVASFIQSGGKVIQDWRFGEFNEYGEWTKDWANDAFGITGIGWTQGTGNYITSSNTSIKIPFYPNKQLHSVAQFSNADGYSLGIKENGGSNGYSLLEGKNTIVIGFQPQILNKLDNSFDWDEYFLELIDGLLNK